MKLKMSRASRKVKKERKSHKNQVWYPDASELALPYVSAEARAAVRAKLDPVLQNLMHAVNIIHEPESPVRLGVKVGCCWEVAQGVVMTAKSDSIKYVEGVWEHLYG